MIIPMMVKHGNSGEIASYMLLFATLGMAAAGIMCEATKGELMFP